MLIAPIMRHTKPKERVDFIVPERIREAVEGRALTYKRAAEICGIPYREFCLMANGHKEVPQEYIHDLIKLDFPWEFFYYIKWERV